MRRYHYLTNCINSTAAKINAMVDRAREITYDTLVKWTGTDELSQAFPDYDWGPGRKGGLRLKDDWAVSYYRSRYVGRKCVYVCHSAIEYIFVAD